MRVTKKLLQNLVEKKKQYLKKPDKQLLKEINSIIDDGINKDKHYYSKLLSYNFPKEDLQYLM